MTKKEQDLIINDTRYYVIKWDNGIIYTKRSLIELRAKKFEKLFKGIKVTCRPCSYNDYFMNNVYILYSRLKARDNFYKKRGYIKKYYPDGSYRFMKRGEDDYL